ncbi:MAG: chromate transporter [Oscillospiraceae bacterium]|jgi:chromate transporter|nr:chromate transporter [Oscillospiraceae bacterium]
MTELLNLFIVFAKIGVCTFGGGYAMVPILERELAEKRGWAESTELLDWYAISQAMPGIIAVNVATFFGCKRRGVIGGIVATLGMVFPSFVIILAIAAVLNNFADVPQVKSAFAGIRACVVVMIITTVLRLWKTSVADRPAIAIFVPIFALSAFTGVPLALLIVASGVAGVAIGAVRQGRGK